MQAAKKAVENVRETAANIGASAKSGLEKTKATVQEKAERMTSHDSVQKDMATQRKEEKINNAEMEKQQAREHNAAVKQSATQGHVSQVPHTSAGPGTDTATHSTAGVHGQPTPTNQMSAMHVHGHGPGPRQEELSHDVVGSHPIGTNTDMGRTTAHNAHVGGNVP